MAAPLGIATTNSGSLAFVFNNLQSAVFGTVGANTNSVGLLPQVLGMEASIAQQMAGRNRGGGSFLQPVNSVQPSTTTPCILVTMSDVFSRYGFTKGGAFLIASNSNGTQAITCDFTNTQTNTNSFWGDTSFTTIYALVLQNFNNVDGVSSGNANWFCNGSVTNGAVFGLNTNGTYIVQPNGGAVVLQSPNGYAVAAATCKLLCTPVNGGSLVIAAYGS